MVGPVVRDGEMVNLADFSCGCRHYLNGKVDSSNCQKHRGLEMLDEEDEIEFEVRRRLDARTQYDGADMLIALVAGLVGGICLVTFIILRM